MFALHTCTHVCLFVLLKKFFIDQEPAEHSKKRANPHLNE